MSLFSPVLRAFPPFAVAAVVFALAGPAIAAGVPLTAYRSVHDLTLDPQSDLPEIGSVTGRLVTEYTGSACAGFTTKSRFVTRTETNEGERQTNDIRFDTYETEDGTFEFHTETFTDDSLVEASAGVARRVDDAIQVDLTKPGEKSVTLGAGTLFPGEQVQQVIGAGLAGKRFLAFDIYDGSEAGETVFGTSTVIGEASTDAADLGEETSVADAGFAAMRHWPVTISYFEKGSDMTPAYTMSLVLYENGITRDVRFNYGSFALIGKLTRLELLPPAPCPG